MTKAPPHTHTQALIKIQALTLKYIPRSELSLLHTCRCTHTYTHTPHRRHEHICFNLQDVCFRYHVHILLFQSQIVFYNDCVKSFASSLPREELEAVHAGLIRRLEQIAELVVVDTSNARTKVVLGALITLYVHCKDILRDLLLKNIFSAGDFEWTR